MRSRGGSTLATSLRKAPVGRIPPKTWTTDPEEHRRLIAEGVDGNFARITALENPAFAGLRGSPAALAITTTRVVITNWPTKRENGLFQGQVNEAAGQITIPETGAYTARCSFTGVLSGSVASSEVIVYLRSSLTGDLPADAEAIVLGTIRVGFNFAVWGDYTENEILSVAIDSTGNLGTLTFAGASFDVRAET